jgi:hypothetical protein
MAAGERESKTVGKGRAAWLVGMALITSSISPWRADMPIEFLKAFFSHWYGWITGAALTLPDVVARFFRWKVPRRLWLVLVSIGVITSSYFTWRNERVRRDKAEDLSTSLAAQLASAKSQDSALANQLQMSQQSVADLTRREFNASRKRTVRDSLALFVEQADSLLTAFNVGPALPGEAQLGSWTGAVQNYLRTSGLDRSYEAEFKEAVHMFPFQPGVQVDVEGRIRDGRTTLQKFIDQLR